jgi:hypothetical protein
VAWLRAGDMRKQFFIFIVGLVRSVTLRPIPIAAKRSAEPQSEEKQLMSLRQPRKNTDGTEKMLSNDLRGTDSSPVAVKVLPTPKTKEETAQEQQTRQDQSDANWWMVKLTGVIGMIGLLQLWVFGRQARRLKETILKMEEIAKGQTDDMRASIGEATRAATASSAYRHSGNAYTCNARTGESDVKNA